MRKLTLILATLSAGVVFAQQPTAIQLVNQTSLATAAAAADTQLQLAANYTAASPLGAVAVANGINLPNLFNTTLGNAVGSMLYIVDPGSYRGEAVQIVSQIATGRYSVKRGLAGTKATPHISGAMVLVGPPQAFAASEPQGACFVSGAKTWTEFAYPNLLVNVQSGEEWLCSTVTGTWVAGFQNVNEPSPTTAVASAASITPSGPLFHVTGTAAIANIVLPLGFSHGSITIIADGVFSWTNAGNIAVASSTVVVGKQYIFSYDYGQSKWYPSSQ